MTDAERIAHLERELAEERHSREVAAKKAWEFSDQFRAMSWQPIETAPKETSVLIYGFWEGELHAKEDQREIWKAHFAYDKWWIEGGEFYAQHVISPTHWMPLPEPPNVSRETIEIARKKS